MRCASRDLLCAYSQKKTKAARLSMRMNDMVSRRTDYESKERMPVLPVLPVELLHHAYTDTSIPERTTSQKSLGNIVWSDLQQLSDDSVRSPSRRPVLSLPSVDMEAHRFRKCMESRDTYEPFRVYRTSAVAGGS